MNEREIFTAALEITNVTERSAYLDAACAGHDELRQRLDALLAEHEKDDSFLLDSPPPGLGATSAMPPATESPGVVIGPYKLLEQIGEGGMGIVYMADQQSPVRRRVALKIIKPGMDTRQVIARFEAERQALALMDHPNIARVLDAGTTPSGGPYFVMELVRGVTITRYCDENSLPVHERLELFIQVCHAVQHAHQKGIIHRDLKPSNILVSINDGRPVPKVIDFGIAKATNQRLTDKTLFTNFSQMIGTPLYMSPEQAEMTSLDVDTRSDIYSLGVLLYELLTGTTPFDKDRLREAAFDEIRRIIREEEPAKPSTRISTMEGATRAAVSASRRTDVHRLSQRVRGDLDWIVMKALEKDRARRYETAGNFAADVLRHLTNQPVEACPPSSVYRLRKFARRNRVALTSGLLMLAVLILGTVVSTWQAIRATRSERVAEAARLEEAQQRTMAENARVAEAEQRTVAENERNEAQKQRQAAEANLRKARAAVDTYFTRVSENRLISVPGLQPLRKQLLESALTYYQDFIAQHKDDPTLERDLAATYARVGRITIEIGSREDSRGAYKHAIDIFEKLVRDNPAASDYQRQLATAYLGLAAGQSSDSRQADAEVSLNRAIELGEALAAKDPNSRETRSTLQVGYYNLASVQSATGRLSQSEANYRKAIEIQEKLSAEFPDDDYFRASLSNTYRALGNVINHIEQEPLFKKSTEPLYKKSIQIAEALSAQHPDSIEYQRLLGDCYLYLGQLQIATGRNAEAERSMINAAEIFGKLVHENPAVGDYQGNLAKAYSHLSEIQRMVGRMADADASYKQALTILEGLVRENPVARSYSANLGRLHFVAGKWDEAAASFAQSSEALRKLAEEQSSIPQYTTKLALSLSYHGDALAMAGKWKESVDTFAEAVDLNADNWYTMYKLALAQFAAGDEPAYRVTCANLLALYGTNPKTIVAFNIVLACVVGEKAVADMDKVVALAERISRAEPLNPVYATVLGAAQFRAGRTAQAIATLEKAGPGHAVATLAAPHMADAISGSQLLGEVFLGYCYREVGDRKKSQRQVKRVTALVQKLEDSPPRLNELVLPWALRFAVATSKRQLAAWSAADDDIAK